MDVLLDQLILGTAWAHVLLAPYTKVEESFNLHATHDVLMYGVGPAALPNVRNGTVSFRRASPFTLCASTTTLHFPAQCLGRFLAVYCLRGRQHH